MRRRLKVRWVSGGGRKGLLPEKSALFGVFFWISLSSGAFSLDVFPEMPYDVK